LIGWGVALLIPSSMVKRYYGLNLMILIAVNFHLFSLVFDEPLFALALNFPTLLDSETEIAHLQV
jgi:hypothetical protein